MKFELGEVKVTVICIVYNQEKYLQKCLDGFAEQITNFRFEVIIHDDASTDRSAEIISDYHKQYKDIFVPILQKTNQYSKGVPFFQRLLDEAKGEYIALCEGDDYWCDPYKLQKQFDFMNDHPECSMCAHNSIAHDLSGLNPDRKFMNTEGNGEWKYLNEEQIFNYWTVHNSSYFIRNNYDIFPSWGIFFWAGDYVMLAVAYANGKIGVLNDVMSVYNCNNPNGMTANVARSSDVLKKKYDRVIFLKKYLEYYPEINDEAKTAIQARINAIEEYMEVSEFCDKLSKIGKACDKTDIDKYEWLVRALNDEKIKKICSNPSVGLETLNITKELFEKVDRFCDGLGSLKDEIHFSFISWISSVYQSDRPSREYLLAIAASSENEIGWGIKLDGDPEYRHELVLQFANEEKLTAEQKTELFAHMKAATKYVDSGDMRKGLEEVDLALRLSPLNKDLICYKAFIFLCLGDKNACLNEVGIYRLFYDSDESIMTIYSKAKMIR